MATIALLAAVVALACTVGAQERRLARREAALDALRDRVRAIEADVSRAAAAELHAAAEVSDATAVRLGAIVRLLDDLQERAP